MRITRRGALGMGVAAAVVASWVRARPHRYEVAERSMSPALEPGDYVVALRTAGDPMRGDVVIVPHPERPGFDLVKRVIGLPGDTIRIADGRVHVDGAALPEPWAKGATFPDGTWHVGEGEIFVLGDQRAISAADSRSIGPLAVTGRLWTVTFRYWPPRRIDIV